MAKCTRLCRKEMFFMMISTRGRYALRLMVDLANHRDDGFIPLTDVAERQGISEKYLESIVSSLSKKGLVSSARGKGGGYKLNRPANQYTVQEILTVSEGSMAPVACLEDEVNQCENAQDCPTLAMWTNLYKMTQEYFEGISVEDLASGKIEIK